MKEIIFLFFSLLLIGCSPQTSQQATFYVFGTTVEITLPDVKKQEAFALFSQVREQLNHMHNRWHAWQQSELTQINEACKTGEALTLAPETKILILAGQVFEQQSEGYLNFAMGNLLSTWGFLSDEHSKPRAKPAKKTVETLMQYPASLQDLHISENTLFCDNPNVHLDFGAYAKGYAVGEIMAFLKRAGINNALINAGGDIQTLGMHHGRAWQIAVQDPFNDKPLLTIQAKHNESIFTSGTYERGLANDFHHLLNPKTGYPANDFVSVTVIDADPVRADAAATAILVAGQADWQKIAQNMNTPTVLIVTKQGNKIVSPAMLQYLD